MDKEIELNLRKVIDAVFYDHSDITKAARIGLRELMLDAIESAGFKIVPVTHEIDERRRKGANLINERKLNIESDYDKAADAVEWLDEEGSKHSK